ncbi:hypothetical protein CC85DRAFT_178637 [Cutaneotrichosporon oleaginosum]|uniref:C2H2-type domain-containing protein n=1 Tax=Cutaneotrichosporon oleaginosum TaxID=879819 RepID=A0A0J0XFG3_9TREE|nr:uncharacterized protein CC85DRAFT_178637 [Cutaneotrichosporon oleaginosum]KLT39788.1 hypothetical protein CC85DRAFT_178637 [Cutaneotrichosporon oleaginosum]TXT05666.1 hypothetical protein COLE_06986 [Cutaneotrichosporon oleaginosum]
MQPADATTHSQAFFCRWDYCTVSFPTLSALSAHLREHIASERPVYIPVARRRRANGGWVLDASASTMPSFPSNSFPSPSQPHTHTQSSHASRPSIDDFLPPADVSDLGLGVGVEVDFDAFLRSPSPRFTSTPLSQIPLPSHPSAPSATQPSAPSATQPSNAQRQQPSQSDVSSGALVSPPNSMLPPTQPPPPATSESNVSASPRTSLQFGAAETPRRVSAGGVGFTWGSGK